jgi:type I restriction enzyme M protein
MLTQDTKKHIDAARQILVGVVPNPMSQVEQITNALIYKFMDDMDQQAIKAGGDPSFFVKDLEKYAWTKVMDSRLGNQERMNLYTEALMKFSEAKQLPQLFRDIFKQAFLPYRDPEVLGLFLKEISYFDYTHSEELGNAYEYLLSIMSSQGDAGQFRTPRHIIDFIVDVLAPTKDDAILDPACGTGGFLISAYNYIKRQNEGVDPETGKMRQLTADERRKLVNNFEGYDVDPTMVRMSQVNMYLHKFTTPKIYNYNTLASEDRWNDKFDLILANPPFMSPKGGIKPHNKFSVQANRAEVLFVDYIMNHLKPKGRAGIIVPEGIIFQSGKAYKELRKNLVNDGLFAVVSLPAGVFNPYSGVKTSILFFDNEVAKKTKDLLFVKVTSDGYDLGAQRRKIEKDDLGDAGVILKGFREYVRTDQNKETIASFISGSGKGFIVSKEKIAETDDYNLSADRYRVNEISNTKYPYAKLGEVVDYIRGVTFSKKDQVYEETTETIRVATTKAAQEHELVEKDLYFIPKKIVKKNEQILRSGDILISIANSINLLGRTTYIEDKNIGITFGAFMGLIRAKQEIINPKYLFRILRTPHAKKYFESNANTTTNISNLTSTSLLDYEIPLPPLDVQKEIVEQIEVKQKAIEGAKQVIENLERERRYFGQSLRKLEGVEMVKLSEICEVNKKTADPIKLFGNSEFVYIDISSVENGTGFVDLTNKIEAAQAPSRARRIVKQNDILLSTVRPNLKAYAHLDNLPKETLASTGFAVLSSSEKVMSKYLYYILFTDDLQNQMISKMDKGAYPSINQNDVENLIVPVVSKEDQDRLVMDMENQEKIILSNKKLINLMEKKIEEVLSEI